jgi:hypothetical protein
VDDISCTVGMRRGDPRGRPDTERMSLGLFIRLVFTARTTRFRLVQQRPVGASLVKVPDRDTLRVLVFGGGLALGFGVATQNDALAGRLAAELHRRLRRGIVVETKCDTAVTARQMVDLLGPDGAHTYAAVVMVPGFVEGTVPHDVQWRQDLRAVLDHLQGTGAADLRVVVAGLPVPIRGDRATRAIAEGVKAANSALESLTVGRPAMRFAAVPNFETLAARHPFDRDYYGRAAAAVASALESLMLPSRMAARVD